jgi:hypothetical protein
MDIAGRTDPADDERLWSFLPVGNKLKKLRVVATRYGKRGYVFACILTIAATVICLRI